MKIRPLTVLISLLLMSAFGLSACGKKAPLDPPPPREHKEKPANS